VWFHIVAGGPPGGNPHEPHGTIAFPVPIHPFCRSVFTGLVVVGLAVICHAAPRAPELRCDLGSSHGIHTSKDGTISLKWNTVETAASFELAEEIPGIPKVFHTRYSGNDLSSVRTGLAGGTHRFRVRALDASGKPGDWSGPLVVNVEYMRRERLVLLLALGSGVALATIAAILHGHFTHRKKPAT
jgi:hypothetical protein